MTEEEKTQTPASHNDATHAHIKKRVRKKVWAAVEKLALKLLSKLLNISPPPSPASDNRHVNN